MRRTEERTKEITLKSKLRQVAPMVPGIRDLLETIGGKKVPDVAWRMAQPVSLKFIFDTKLGWKPDLLDQLIVALNEAAAAGGEIPRDFIEKVTGTKKSLIEKAEERDLWTGHNVYFERIPFDDLNMGFYTLWALSCAAHDVTSAGEVLHTISEIEDGNIEEWVKEWTAIAERIEMRAVGCLSRNRIVSARDAFMRAAYYYRMATWMMNAREDGYRDIAMKMRTCFRQAATMFAPEIETVQVPYENGSLPGYFRKVAAADEPRPTLIMLGGGETFSEEGYFFMGPLCAKYGYNFFTFEYPGEGLTPYDGFYHRADIEVAVSKALDYLHERPDVDRDRIATYGISQGGYVGPRAAIYDSRIKATVANSFLPDISVVWEAYEPFLDDPEIKEHMPSTWEVIRTCVWRWGGPGESGLELIELNKPFKFDPARVPCPVLILIGEGEYRSSSLMRSMQDEGIKRLPNEKSKLVIAKAEEGMAHHCTLENPAITGEILFEWLDEVFER